jgi:hypothetical protein
MAVYKFELNDGVRRIEDEIGVDLPDHSCALDHACAVVRELMGGCEARTRSWRLNVKDDSGKKLFEIPFVNLDRTLDHLAPELRTMVAELSDRVCSLKEVVGAASITVCESRALVARSRGRPYLATHSGERTIR